jgi:LacI family transcriptional regulator
MEAAEQLGYRVNRIASGLRGGSSRQLGLVVTNLVNASFHTVTTKMQALAHEAGYQLLLCVSQGDPQQEAAFLATLAAHRVDGLVIVCTDRGVAEVAELAASGLPVVGLVRRPAGFRPPVVQGDDERGAHLATRHLIELGHQRIAYIGGLSTTTTGRERFKGFKSAHVAAGLPVNMKLVERGPFDPAFGIDAVKRLFARGRFTALFITNHESVFGALPELSRNGVSVPDDLSLVCYEDVPLFDCWHPPITVVDNAPAEMGRAAFDLLLRQINRVDSADRVPQVVRVPPHLIVRASCSPPRGAPAARTASR